MKKAAILFCFVFLFFACKAERPKINSPYEEAKQILLDMQTAIEKCEAGKVEFLDIDSLFGKKYFVEVNGIEYKVMLGEGNYFTLYNVYIDNISLDRAEGLKEGLEKLLGASTEIDVEEDVIQGVGWQVNYKEIELFEKVKGFNNFENCEDILEVSFLYGESLENGYAGVYISIWIFNK